MSEKLAVTTRIKTDIAELLPTLAKRLFFKNPPKKEKRILATERIRAKKTLYLPKSTKNNKITPEEYLFK
tara:strand:+ start:152 stop:361 length:210 start_codon:yes stop_codon:yes gene_type:complete